MHITNSHTCYDSTIMSLFNYGFTGNSENSRKRPLPKGDGNEATSKKRDFQPSWLEKFKWLRSDDTKRMLCYYCTNSRSAAGSDNPFVKGSYNYKIDLLKSHERSKLHLEAVAEEAAKCNPKETPLARSIDTMEISVHNKMKMLFNTAYHVALHEMPFRAFPGLCALQKKNGLNEIGETYMNDKAASTFISF